MGILQKIITHKIEEVEVRKRKRTLSSFAHEITKSERDFKNALAGGRTGVRPRLIAEIKKASPSEKLLRPHLETELADIVAIYNRCASAISVVTDEKFFQGSLEWIKKIRPLTELPILCKDFIVDEYQLYEARWHGADAVLMLANNELRIANCELRNYIAAAQKLGMDALVEVHNRKELDYALASGAEIIGINNRDLSTFEVSLETTFALAPLVPPDRVVISESGFHTRGDIKKMHGIADAVLIGTTFMKSSDIEEKLRELGFAHIRNTL